VDKLEAVEGELGIGDAAEEAVPIGEPLPHEHGTGTGSQVIECQPYLELKDKVQPLVSMLVEGLTVDGSVPPPEPSDRGGRLSNSQENPLHAIIHVRNPGAIAVACGVTVAPTSESKPW